MVYPNRAGFYKKVAFTFTWAELTNFSKLKVFQSFESGLTNFLEVKVFETFEIRKHFHFQTWQTEVSLL